MMCGGLCVTREMWCQVMGTTREMWWPRNGGFIALVVGDKGRVVGDKGHVI